MTVQTVDPTKPVSITDEAVEYFSNYVSSKDALGIRLGLKGGGCAGYAYDWTLVTEWFPQQEKYVQQYDKFVFILDELSFDLLVGSTVDLEDKGVTGKQVVVHSPKQASECGCGESITFNE